MFTNRSFLPSLSESLVVATFVLLPVLFLPFAWATIAQAKMLIVVVAALVVASIWLLSQLRSGKIAVPASIIVPASLLLPVAYAFSGVLSGGADSFVGSGVELDTVAAMTLWTVAFLMAAVILTPGRVVVRAYRMLLIAALIAALFHIIGIVLGGSIAFGPFVGPAASIVGSWHDLAIFLGLSVLLAASLLGSSFNTGRWHWVAYGVLGISSLLLILINAQDVWIALAAISVIGIGYLWYTGRNTVPVAPAPTPAPNPTLSTMPGGAVAPQQAPAASVSQSGSLDHKTLSMKVLASVAGLAVVFAIFGTTLVGYMPQRLQIGQTEVRPSWRGTSEVLSAVYQGQSAIFGSGPSTFSRAWSLYKPAGVNETAFWNADFAQGVGFIPTAFATTGIVGALAWLLFLAAFLYVGVRALLNSAADPRWRMPLFAIFAGALFLWIMLAVYPPGGTLVALSFLMAGLFLAAARAAGVVGMWSYDFSNSKIGFVVVVALLLVFLAIVGCVAGLSRALAADVFVNRAISTYNATQDTVAAQRNIDRALAITPGNDRALRAAVELNMIRFGALVSDSATTDSEEARTELQATLEKAIQSGLSAVSADSENYQNWLTLAAAYENLAGAKVAGAYENAQQAYEKARVTNPSSPIPYLALARLALAQEDTVSARENLTQALILKNNYAPAWYLLSQIDASENNLASSTIAAQNAAASAPSEPLAWLQLGTLYYAQQQYEQAVAALSNAVILNANYANALYVLGFAEYQNGNPDAALGYFERVAALNPDNADVAAIVASLKETKKLPEPAQ